VKPICDDHDCVLFINNKSVFRTNRTRSKIVLPQSFEAKFYIKKMNSKNVLIGLTDNPTFEDESISLVDNVWLYKPFTGEKYSSLAGTESFIKPAKEKDFIIIRKEDWEVYFSVNYQSPLLAYNLKGNNWKQEFYFYLENDNPFEDTEIIFVYMRKI
jgi:hypothetical protein